VISATHEVDGCRLARAALEADLAHRIRHDDPPGRDLPPVRRIAPKLAVPA
jgi:hypothetical protein